MAETNQQAVETPAGEDIRKELEEIEYTGRKLSPRVATIIGAIAAAWSLFQLWIASPLPFWLDFGIIVDVPARGIHLAFGLLLCYLIYPFSRRSATATKNIPVFEIALALAGMLCAAYLWLAYAGLSQRAGILLKYEDFLGLGFTLPIEMIIGGIGIVLLLEATRRSIGKPLVILALIFLVYSVFGQSMPDIISHKGVSMTRLIGYQWFSGESIFGIPIDVSVDFVFLFVLFGAMLDKAGAGKYFLDLAFAAVGQYRGGPAKAAILASGMTGLISGSSIANTVTTGTFTIPVMRSIGMPAVKAGAIEVAASVNGQIMPPIMGAAAFVMAELIGITYFEVIKAAFIPAFISYIALLYISHLEALKLGLKGLPKSELPNLWKTFISGVHFLIPVVVLIYLLMVEKWSPESAVFYSILILMVIIVWQKIWAALRSEGISLVAGILNGVGEIYQGMIGGAKNMITIAVAVATAGIIVGAVSSTGLSNMLIGVIEVISGGNVYILLVLTALLCIVLGMGLPTTANYLVVASLLAGVLVELGSASGLVLPLIAVHLYVFYFGLMADVTPPVALAAFAASAISRADPVATGIQAFAYHIRTAILPFVFIFNTELLLIGVDSWLHGVMVFFMSLIAILAFTSFTLNIMFVKNKIWESVVLVIVAFAMLRPGVVLNQVYPEFQSYPISQFVSGEADIPAARTIRVKLTRETDYGPRYKLYTLTTPDMRGIPIEDLLQWKLKDVGGGEYEVVDVGMNGLAEQVGITWYDTVTAIDIEQVHRPDKEWVYPIGLLLLLIVIVSQWRRREPDAADVAARA